LFAQLEKWDSGASIRLVLLGGGGSGKTAATLAAWSRYADRVSVDDKKPIRSFAAAAKAARKLPVLPIFLPLPSVPRLLEPGGLDACIAQQLEVPVKRLQELHTHVDVVLLLDSLDEVPNLSPAVARRGLLHGNPFAQKCRVVMSTRDEVFPLLNVTSAERVLDGVEEKTTGRFRALVTERILKQRGVGSAEMLLVQPLSDEQIRAFVEKKLAKLSSFEVDRAARRILGLDQATKRHPGTLLQACSLILADRGALNDADRLSRANITDSYLELSVTTRVANPADRRSVWNAMEDLSVTMMEARKWQLTVGQVTDALHAHKVPHFIKALPARIEDYKNKQSSFSWGHKTFGELLAAKHLLKREEPLSRLIKLGTETAQPVLEMIQQIGTREQKLEAATVLVLGLRQMRGSLPTLRALERDAKWDPMDKARILTLITHGLYDEHGCVTPETAEKAKQALGLVQRECAYRSVQAALYLTDGELQLKTAADNEAYIGAESGDLLQLRRQAAYRVGGERGLKIFADSEPLFKAQFGETSYEYGKLLKEWAERLPKKTVEDHSKAAGMFRQSREILTAVLDVSHTDPCMAAHYEIEALRHCLDACASTDRAGYVEKLLDVAAAHTEVIQKRAFPELDVLQTHVGIAFVALEAAQWRDPTAAAQALKVLQAAIDTHRTGQHAETVRSRIHGTTNPPVSIGSANAHVGVLPLFGLSASGQQLQRDARADSVHYSLPLHRAHIQTLWQLDPVDGDDIVNIHRLWVNKAKRQENTVDDGATAMEVAKPDAVTRERLLANLVSQARIVIDEIRRGDFEDSDDLPRLRSLSGIVYTLLTTADRHGHAPALDELGQLKNALKRIRHGDTVAGLNLRKESCGTWGAPDSMTDAHTHAGCAMLYGDGQFLEQLDKDSRDGRYSASLHHHHLALLRRHNPLESDFQVARAHKRWVEKAAASDGIDTAAKAVVDYYPTPDAAAARVALPNLLEVGKFGIEVVGEGKYERDTMWRLRGHTGIAFRAVDRGTPRLG